ncbi:MAG: tRNA pseudouridine(38-40) synthase TruA [Pseudomonadota bacterium]|nr:tRNA pseudouridine(38-40) synthase TruA [Pseudomonadota bacterium]
MQRYKLTVEYDGSDFVGWQRQINGLGIQEALELAVRNFCGESVTVFGSGRTDAGVHAISQVAHFDIKTATDSDTVRDALNYYLKKDSISVLAAEAVNQEFHARFSAKSRSYLYRIVSRRAPVTIDHGRVWWVPVNLNTDEMGEASLDLLGKHDFSTFRAAECQADSPIKTLDEIRIDQIPYPGGLEVQIHVRAKSFLYHQVRNFAGSLKLVGEGRWSINDFKTAFKAADRSRGGPTAPAEGLYFVDVSY